MSASIPNLPSQYEAAPIEAKWQQYWEENKVFTADVNQGGKTFSIVIPPPNVTGSLHMGHAFETALIDTLVRYHRMIGDNTLCLPGTDHASIAVQTLIEKQLKAEGKTRYDLGREEFLEKAWQWKEESGGKIVNQLRRLGLSADWTRERFTMDEGRAKSVLHSFITLYEEGLIYRGNYMVNWCPESQSAVSDLEVENKEVDGHLWHFRYPLTEGNGYVEVATTRPETMLGDTGIAVNPNDERYQNLIGKTVTLPLVGREIPIFADELVDPEFGTGCVKVTPAHDPNDFAMGKRHELPFINILNKDGTLNENAGEFVGQDRFEARKNVVERLKEEEFLVKVEEYRHTVPYSDRGKVPVEPLISTQWFVRIDPLAKRALSALDEEKSPHFVPQRWEKVYRDWLVKLQDWCISRQLWWGHQIPAWYAVSETGGEIRENTPFVVAYDEVQAREKAMAKFGEEVQLERDPDVLDTWFSSGLWPFSTLGWPEDDPDYRTYYPTSTLVTGFDIIFFWVARMTMMAGHFTDKMPFKDVYIHGLVLDEKGQKMSKSKGNGIDPLLMVDKYGTDALRYALIKKVAGAGQDISFDYDRNSDESESVEAARNFANKIWNASRFVIMNLDGKTPQELGTPDLNNLELSDHWILSRYYGVLEQTRNYLDRYSLGEGAKGLYDFIWGDFCDWYIELVKSRLRQEESSASRLVAQQILAHVLEGILRLLHPFMPHITEEIWHTLTQPSGEILAQQSYPEVDELTRGGEETSVNTPQVEVVETREVKASVSSLPQGEQFKPSNQFFDSVVKDLQSFTRKSQPVLSLIILALVVLIAGKVAAALLVTVSEIPLLEPMLQIVGLGYTGWFAWRYLLKPENRQELGENVTSFLGQLKLSTTPPLAYEMVNNMSSTSPSSPSNPVSISSPVASSNKESTPAVPKITTIINPQLEEDFELIIGVIRTIRNLRAEAEIKPGVKVTAILQSESEQEKQILSQGETYIQDLAKVENLTITTDLEEESGQVIAGVVGTVQILIPLTGVVDVDTLRSKLDKKLAKLTKEIQSLTKRLSNPGFINKAPEDIIQGAKDNLEEAQKQVEILQERLQYLQ